VIRNNLVDFNYVKDLWITKIKLRDIRCLNLEVIGISRLFFERYKFRTKNIPGIFVEVLTSVGFAVNIRSSRLFSLVGSSWS
jgi:hypothetical protein